MPTAPPICCDVLMSPEARPASSCFVPATAAIVTGTNANGSPMPMMRKPGKRSGQVRAVDGETCVKYSRPTVIIDIPNTSADFTPIRVTAAAATFAQMIAVPATTR